MSTLAKSLLEELPGIVAAGKRQAAQILEQLEGRNRVTLQTRELVIPSKDSINRSLFGTDEREREREGEIMLIARPSIA